MTCSMGKLQERRRNGEEITGGWVLKTYVGLLREHAFSVRSSDMDRHRHEGLVLQGYAGRGPVSRAGRRPPFASFRDGSLL